jgi:hypothetical protein
MKATYQISFKTELRIRTTLRIRISTLWQQRRKTQSSVGVDFANRWWNNDIREAISTYREFLAGEVF